MKEDFSDLISDFVDCRYIGSVGQRVRGIKNLTHYVRIPRNTVRSPNFALSTKSVYKFSSYAISFAILPE